MLLRDLHPGGAKRDLSTLQASKLLTTLRPVTPTDIQRKVICRDILSDIRRIDDKIKTSTRELATEVSNHGSTLTEIHGLGTVLAAKILAHSGNVTRFPSKHHFASYCGTAPVEASSGDHQRHRLSRAGNRQLNSAIHVIAICQARDPAPRPDPLPPQTRRSKDPSRSPPQPKKAALEHHYKRLMHDTEQRLAPTP